MKAKNPKPAGKRRRRKREYAPSEVPAHFSTFTHVLENAISRYEKDPDQDMTSRQKAQVEGLVAAEVAFRDRLITHKNGLLVYQGFIQYIKGVKRNILSALPYFRERQDIFVEHISPALKRDDARALFTWGINYMFVRWVMKSGIIKHRPGSQLSLAAELVRSRREELIETNMPLALSRTRIFWNATRRRSSVGSNELVPGGAHLDYMDLVQLAAEGLCAGIDKFCLPYTPVFRSVCIGRMVGNFIENNSETLLRFLHHDRRKIYRINKAIGRLQGAGPFSEEEIKEINRGFESRHETNPREISELIIATDCISSDVKVFGDEDTAAASATSLVDTFASPLEHGPDKQAENNELRRVVGHAIGELGMLDRKLLRLKGVALGA